MGYDRNDPWMTCGEHEDREVKADELTKAIRKAFNASRDGFEEDDIAERLLSQFIILRA
jgi:hypothetical protein